MTIQISQDQYSDFFSDNNKRKNAIEHALDIRKHEIDLYWKRASYFWTFIGATLAGYIAVQASSMANKADYSIVLSCLGLVFSFGWFCANKGSKFWQENWENHVDMLENETTGPLYKISLSRPKPKGFHKVLDQFITGPSKFSTSKINQIISLYVNLLWVYLLFKSIPKISIKLSTNWGYVGLIGFTVLACAGILFLGRTSWKSYQHVAEKRDPKIIPPI